VTLFDGFTRRSLENPGRPLTDTSLLELLGGTPSRSGVDVSERSALRMSAVYRAVAVNSNVPASLPLHAYRKGTREVAEHRLLEEPHPDMTLLEVLRLSFVHRNLWGNAYLQKVRDRAGQIRELWPIMPDRVQVGKVQPDQVNRSGKVFRVLDDWGEEHALTPREILHLPGLGYDTVCGVSPIRAASEAIGMGLAAEEYGAKLFGSGSLMSGILQSWREKIGSGNRNAHEVAILDSGAKFQPVSMPSRDAQFIESRQFQIYEMARYFGVPPFLLFETSKSTSWGTGLEQQALGWVQYDLNPAWLAPTEARLTREILAPDGLYAKYSVQGLMRGDSMARAQFYRTLRDVGAFSANDIRELEDRGAIEGEGGDIYLQPMNYVPLGTQTVNTGGQQRLPDQDPPADDEEEEQE
jgi:HK97 family phage portal protein